MDRSELEKVAFGTKAEDLKMVNKGYGRSAYMLLYERSSIYGENKQKLNSLRDGLLKDQKTNLHESLMLSQSQLQSHKEVQNMSHRKMLFYPELAAYFVEVARMSETSESSAESDEPLWKAVVVFYLYVLLRSADTSKAVEMTELLCRRVRKLPAFALKLLQSMIHKQFICEFLLDCPVISSKKLISSVMCCAISSVQIFFFNTDILIIPLSKSDIEVALKTLEYLSQTIYCAICESEQDAAIRRYGYVVLERLSRIKQLIEFMSEEDYPENILHMIGFKFINNLDNFECPVNPNPPRQWFEFKGYQKAKDIITFKNLQATEGPEMNSHEHSLDYSAAITVVCNILNELKTNHKELKRLLFGNNFNYWINLIKVSKANYARAALAKLTYNSIEEKHRAWVFKNLLPTVYRKEFVIGTVNDIKSLLTIYSYFMKKNQAEVVYIH